MSYRIKNTALDHNKRFLHRKAAKMQMEPVIAGGRLRLRSSMVISDELFAHNKANLELWKSWGVVEWEKVGEEKAPVVDVENDKKPEETAPPASTDTSPPAPPPPGLFSVLLTEVGENKIGVVKALRESSTLSLQQAGDAVSMAPSEVLSGVDEATASKLVTILTEAGAKAHLEEKKTDEEKKSEPEKAPPHAETVPQQTRPQPKSSPFKGKKQ